MSGMRAIIKKELRTYFFSPIAYVVGALFFFLVGTIFMRLLQAYQQHMNQQRMMMGGDTVDLNKIVTILFQNVSFLLCLIIPFLTIRLFAEEKRQNTMEMLLTAPLSVSQIVWAKFLSAWIFCGFILLLTTVFPGFLFSWGQPEISPMLLNYLGLFLLAGAFLSLGTLMSSLTSSQVIAAILTFVATLLLWILPGLVQGLSVKWGVIDMEVALAYLSPSQHFNSFAEGLLQVKDVIFFASFIVTLLFLTQRVVESHRWR